MDIFQTETFKEATSRAIGKPLGRNQGNPQTADDTAAVCDITPRIKRTGSILDKTPPPFYLFSSKAEYIQVLQWVSYRTSNRAINKQFNNIRLQGIFTNYFSYQSTKDIKVKLLLKRMQSKSKQLQQIKIIVTIGDQQLLVRYQNTLEIISLLISYGPF